MFFSALREVFPDTLLTNAVGIEIDPSIAAVAEQVWSGHELAIIQGDFTIQSPQSRFNLLLANPPYVRHHHLIAPQKALLQANVYSQTGYKVNGLAGLYCYFVLLAHQWLAEDAIAAWLIPSEFMEVNYGDVLRRYLTEQVTLIHVHRPQKGDLQFDDALVSSAIIFYRTGLPSPDHSVHFSAGGRISNPEQSQTVPVVKLREHRKWGHFAMPSLSSKTRNDNDILLSDLFIIKRGIATGANTFFILSREEAAHHRLPKRFLYPILPSPRYLTKQIIEADHEGFPLIENQLVLLDCALPFDQVQHAYPDLAAYLNVGKQKGLDRRYLATKRTPWYRQEQRSVAPFLCTYMGRNPFRFFWNQP